MDPQRKRDLADRADVAGSVTAGTVGTALGAAKLRDAFEEEHPAGHAKAVASIKRGIAATKVKPEIGARAGHLIVHGKPGGFTPLAVGAGAVGLAAAAGRYSTHVKNSQAKEARRVRDAAARQDVAKSAFGIVHPDVIIKKQPGILGAAQSPNVLTGKKAKKAAKKAAAQAAPAPAVEEPAQTVGSRMRMHAAKANPSMPKAEQIYDEVRGAMKSPGKLVRHGPTVAAVGAGLAAGALIHHNHKKDVAKSAFGVVHPDGSIEKKLIPKNPYAVPHMVAEPVRRAVNSPAGKLAVRAAKEHGKYIAGAAGVGSAGAVGTVLANRARKAAPAAVDRAVAAKFPMPKAGPAIAIGAGGVLAAGALAHHRHKKESLDKSAFGVEHPQLETGAVVLPFKLRQANSSTQSFDETGSLR